MELVKNLEELLENMDTLDRYLALPSTAEEKEFAQNLIRAGRCFVVKKSETGCRFYPSRFIGYAHNTRGRHVANTEKDGRVTNPAITKILGGLPMQNAAMELEYQKYVSSLAGSAYKNKRTFWIL